nr:MAG TPA: hypothetical protein [Caudoviricetes sp.]
MTAEQNKKSKFAHFVFYETFDKSLDELSDEQQLKFYRAITKYGLYGEEPEFEGLEKAFWKTIQDALASQVGRQTTNRQNGKLGGAPKKNQNAKKETKNNQKETENNQKQPNGIRIELNRTEMNRIGNFERELGGTPSGIPPTPKQVYDFYLVYRLNVLPYKFYKYQSARDWKDEKGNEIKNWRGAYIKMNESDKNSEAETLEHNSKLIFNLDDYRR